MFSALAPMIRASVVGLALAAKVIPAYAGITYVTSERLVQIVDSCCGPSKSAPGGGQFDATLSVFTTGGKENDDGVQYQAVQSSYMDKAAGHFSGTGSAKFGSGAGFADHEATSLYQLGFVIDSPFAYHASGHVATTLLPNGTQGMFSLGGYEEGASDWLNLVLHNVTGAAETFDVSGILAPGWYFLSAWADAGFDTFVFTGRQAEFSFEFDLVPVNETGSRVPEPSSAGLVGIALLALVRRGKMAR